MSSEIRIRVKPIVKELLEANKEKYGFSINFQVNFAIFKYLVLEVRVPLWKLDNRPDPHYETINKMPDEAIELNKFCDVDSCEIPFNEKSDIGLERLFTSGDLDARTNTDSKPRGDKC